MPYVIIADDSMFQRFTYAKVAKEEGFKVKEAANGQQCIDHVAENPPAGILLDLNMPDVTGLEVLEYIKQHNIQTKVLVITADIQETTKAMVMDLGASAIGYKPINEQVLRYFLTTLNS